MYYGKRVLHLTLIPASSLPYLINKYLQPPLLTKLFSFILSIKRISNTLSRTAFRSSFACPFRSFFPRDRA
ncbi:hypothetical protein I3843_13G147900 [Carya illinoinensis]|nr:hypothetical protein I3843_13G147900 [Carya illinoinensis]